MNLVTSNETKLKEFQRILPDMKILKGLDLREVQGTPEEVILYKSVEAGKDAVVEDTILIIEGEEIIDIKWKIGELKNLKTQNRINATWQVMLGYNDGEYIKIYKGSIDGVIIPESTDDGYGFDPYFLPNGSDITLGKLEELGKKDIFSARKNALIKLKDDDLDVKYNISILPPWIGAYQNEE